MFTKSWKSFSGDLDRKVMNYLVAVAHVQHSLALPLSEKIGYIDTFDTISKEMNAIVEQVKRSDVNAYNQREVDEYLQQSLRGISEDIERETRKIGKAVMINRTGYFSLKSVIDDLSRVSSDRIVITRDRIDRLFSYHWLFRREAEKQEIDAGKETKEAAARFDRDLEEIRLKTFMEMLRGNANTNPEFYYKTNSFIQRQMTDRQVPFSPIEGEEVGLSFIDTGTDEMKVWYLADDVRIRYTASLVVDENQVTVDIRGQVNKAEHLVDFSVSERYPVSLYEQVVNSYGLKVLIERYNESFITSMRSESESTAKETAAKQVIREFFDRPADASRS